MLSLECKYLSIEPLLVQILHFVHLLGQLAQVDELQISDPAECLFGVLEILLLQGINSKSPPILFCHSQASQSVSHRKLMSLEESEEG